MILHFSHIGLTDGRTFMMPFGACNPDGEALETRAFAAAIPRSGWLPADGPLDLSATGEYSAVSGAARADRKEHGMDVGIGLPATIPGVEAAQVLEWARRAERRDFSSLGTIDRIAY